jgi:hypothetical protein
MHVGQRSLAAFVHPSLLHNLAESDGILLSKKVTKTNFAFLYVNETSH